MPISLYGGVGLQIALLGLMLLPKVSNFGVKPLRPLRHLLIVSKKARSLFCLARVVHCRDKAGVAVALTPGARWESAGGRLVQLLLPLCILICALVLNNNAILLSIIAPSMTRCP